MPSIHWNRRSIIYAAVTLTALFFITSTITQPVVPTQLTPQHDPNFPDNPNDEILDPECTITNHQTGHFFDLRELSNLHMDDTHSIPFQAWNAKGFDYGKNFSIGICSSPLRQINALTDLDFPTVANKSNVAGYYTGPHGEKVSIGDANSNLKFRGNQLLLEYENGDLCENGDSTQIRKSTLVTFRCDREMMSKARLSYIGSFHNCSYVFELRTIHACPAARDETESNIVSVFFAILLAAIGVYLGANKLYKLTEYYMGKRSSGVYNVV